MGTSPSEHQSLGRNESERILLLAQSGRDSELAASSLRDAGLQPTVCPSIAQLCEEAGDPCRVPVGAVILTEESLGGGGHRSLARVLETQPTWSDLPVVLLTARSSSMSAWRLGDLLGALGNITLIERPIKKATLITAVQVALRQRRRQYAMRDLLQERQREIELRDHFLAMLGHELRNPLSAITLAHALLENDDPSRFDRYRAVVDRQVTNLRRLVGDILDVSRMNRGKLRIERESIDIRHLTEIALDSHRETMNKRQLRLERVFTSEAVGVAGDALRLEQVIHNLLDNATKFTPAGGWVRVELERALDLAVLRVSDSGEGIEKDELREVFGLFSQPEESKGKHRGGLGLGLALVEQLVRLHGGSVEAFSEGPGKGATFEVRLPLLTQAEEANLARHDLGREATGDQRALEEKGEERPAEPKEQRRPKRRLLLVEDDDDNREMLSMILRRRGVEVTTAANGTEAIRLLREVRPEVCLIDIGLPDIDGYQVGRHARELLGQEVLLLALTGFGHPEAKRQTKEAGFDVHLTKPVDLARLQSLLMQDESRHRTEPGRSPPPP